MIELRDLHKTLIFFFVPVLIFTIGISFFQYPLNTYLERTSISCLFISLFLLLAGYIFKKHKKSNYIRSIGWLIFAFYWSSQVNTLYHSEQGDIVNATLSGVGVFLLTYFAYKDLCSSKMKCLPWLAGVASISGIIYFTMEFINFIKISLIKIVATHTAMLYSIFDHNIRAEGELIWAGYDYIKNSSPTAEIIFACTAIQSILLFVGLIIPLEKVSIKRKTLSLLILIPTVYFLNLIRNSAIVYLVGYRITDMSIAHNYIGKSGSLIALIILVYLLFKYMPELYDKIICTINLYKDEGFVERTIRRLIS